MGVRYKALIVDDEPPARDLLEAFIKRVPFMQCVGASSNAIQALELVEQFKPDLLFLDINMPHISGLDLLGFQQLKTIDAILTTAYADHALKSYEFGVVDYLLKPIAFERFMKAVLKFKDKKQHQVANIFNLAAESEILEDKIITAILPGSLTSKSDFDSIWIREEKKIYQIQVADILYIEGMKDYVKVHLTDRTIITHLTMIKAEGIFSSPVFLRVHRSFIVRRAAIKSILGNTIMLINRSEILIGPTYRDSLKITIDLL